MIEFIVFLISTFFIISLGRPRVGCPRRLRLAEILTIWQAEYDMKREKETNEQNT